MNQTKKKNKIDRFSLIAVGFLIAVTANPFFYETVHPIVLGTLYYGFVFLKRGKKVNPKFILIILFICIVFAGQYVTVGNFNIVTLFGVLMRFFLAYFVVSLIKEDFFIVTARFVTLAAYLSLFVYIPLTLFPSLVDFLISNVSPYLQAPFVSEFRPHIIIFDLSSMHLKRFGNFGLNSGFYWEPGAHAIFLTYALAINIFKNKKIITKNNLILILTVLTTFSTTGYLCLTIIIFFYLLTAESKSVRFRAYFLVLPILTFLVYISFSNLTFLNDKIREDIALTSSDKNEGSRFQSFLLDLQQWQQNPFFGKDRAVDEKGIAFVELTYELHRNNGLGVLLGTYGIFAFFGYLIMVYKSLILYRKHYKLSNKFSTVFMIIFLLTSFGMPMTLRPYYYALVILPIIYKEKKIFNKRLN